MLYSRYYSRATFPTENIKPQRYYERPSNPSPRYRTLCVISVLSLLVTSKFIFAVINTVCYIFLCLVLSLLFEICNDSVC